MRTMALFGFAVLLFATGAAAVCVDKQDGCATCLNGQRCSKCYPVGYGLVQGVCKKCLKPNCILCNTNFNKCTVCAPGYGVDAATSACVQCADPSCLSCRGNPATCTRCVLGWAPSGGQCFPCSYGSGAVGGKCVKCQAKNCAACNGDARRCTTCGMGGWTLSTRQGQCYRCKVPGCDRCEDNNPHSCASCAQKRENRGGVCV